MIKYSWEDTPKWANWRAITRIYGNVQYFEVKPTLYRDKVIAYWKHERGTSQWTDCSQVCDNTNWEQSLEYRGK